MTKSLFVYLEEEQFSTAWHTAGKFVIGGSLWIVISDLIVFFTRGLDQPHFPLFHIEVLKGLLFVLAMGIFIFFLLRARQSKERIPLLFMENPTPMWIFDIETLKILSANKAAVSAYGYARSEFEKMTLMDLAPAHEHNTVRAAVKQLNVGLFYKGTWKHCQKDGTIVPTEVHGQAISYQGYHAALVSVNDLSKIARLEEELVLLEQEYERQVGIRMHDTLLSNTELMLRLKEINATNDELVSINRMLLDANRALQQRTELEHGVRVEQLQRLLERNEYPAWSWHVHDPALRCMNAKARSLFLLDGLADLTTADFWKQKIDAFDKPLVDIHLAILEKDDVVEFTYKLAGEDVLVRQKISVIRNDHNEPIIYEFEARPMERNTNTRSSE